MVKLHKIDQILLYRDLNTLLNPGSLPNGYVTAGLICTITGLTTGELVIQRADWDPANIGSLVFSTEKLNFSVSFEGNPAVQNEADGTDEFDAVFFSLEEVNNLLYSGHNGNHTDLHISRAFVALSMKAAAPINTAPEGTSTGSSTPSEEYNFAKYRTLKLRPEPDPIPHRYLEGGNGRFDVLVATLVERDTLNYAIGTPCPPIWRPSSSGQSGSEQLNVGVIVAKLYADKLIPAEKTVYEMPLFSRLKLLFRAIGRKFTGRKRNLTKGQ